MKYFFFVVHQINSTDLQIILKMDVELAAGLLLGHNTDQAHPETFSIFLAL